MDKYESENEDLKEQLKHQSEIIDSLMNMKDVLKTQIALEKEVMKQNLLNEQTFMIMANIDDVEEECEDVEDSTNLLSDNICLEAENNCLKDILEQLNGDKDYLVETKLEIQEEQISRTGDFRRMSFDSQVGERQIYKDVLEEIKQQSNVRLNKKQLKLKCLKMEKKLNSRMLFPKTVEDGDNKEMVNVDCFLMENVRFLQKLGICFEETTLAITEMKKDKTAYVTLNKRDKHPVSFLQVRKFLRQMDIIYDEDEEAAKIEYIMQFLPVIFELIQLKCNILKYHKKTKILLASRLLHLEKISQNFVNKGLMDCQPRVEETSPFLDRIQNRTREVTKSKADENVAFSEQVDHFMNKDVLLC
eukprot:TRINITY_DN47353_c0_g1_i1.p1 TRINITY_DN47353_c0_g1~~TRINITY_DN47353_c0_g1_i1.p1  ORF type:complete len:370 (-),score=104.31 TRINITY_DN47353_c0_g1_i1:23-1102(-)